MFGMLLCLLVLIGDVWAIVNVFQSVETMGKKVFWVVLILVLPFIGLAIWYFAGPRSA